jgi:hypothetical protein
MRRELAGKEFPAVGHPESATVQENWVAWKVTCQPRPVPVLSDAV